MGFDFFKRKIKTINVNVDENGNGRLQKKNKWIIVLILGAVLILAFWNSDGDKNEKPTEHSVGTMPLSAIDENYIQNAEHRLCDILSGIKGAGKVKAMITFDAGEEKVLAKNQSSQLETQHSEGETQSKSQQEEDILIYDLGQGEEPFVLKEKLPVVSGVLVVADGASQESVRLELYEAIKALYGISGHRIKISAATVK